MVQKNINEVFPHEPKPDPAYQRLYEMLKCRIGSGKLKPGDQLPTESLLLEEFRVSRNTVRHALAGLEREGLIVRFPRKGTFVRQAPEGMAKAKKYTVGVTFFSENMNATFYGPLTRGVLAAARKNNLVIEVVPVHGDENYDGLDGCLFNYEIDPHTRIYKQIAKGIMPAVGYNFRIGRKCGFVGVDYYAESFKAVRHLLNCGCRRIAYIGKPFDPAETEKNRYISATVSRFNGYRDALKQAGIPCPDSSVALLMPKQAKCYREVIDFLTENRFDALFVSQAGLFPYVLYALTYLKRGISPDLRLFCFDDLAQEKMAWPGFSYIRMPLFEIGYTMMDSLYQQMLLQEKAKPIDRIFPADFITVPKIVISEKKLFRSGIAGMKDCFTPEFPECRQRNDLS